MNEKIKRAFYNKKILITGGAGFIGSHLTDKLNEIGAKVVIIDRSKNNISENIINKKNLTIIEGDLSEISKQFLINNEFEYIFHLAGNANVRFSVEKPVEDFESHLIPTMKLLNILKDMNWDGKLIFASSAAVYGNTSKFPIEEEDPIFPISPYGVSKLAVEHYLRTFNLLYGIKTVSLRFFSPYGPRLKKQVVFDIFKKLHIDSKEITILGDGQDERDFIYIDDLIYAILFVSDSANYTGDVYNIASGNSILIVELIENITKICNLTPQFNFSNESPAGYPQKWRVSIEKLKSIGFMPKVGLLEGLEKTYNWFGDIYNK